MTLGPILEGEKMSGFAKGGKPAVFLPLLMGISILLVSIFVDPVGHMITFVGVFLLMLSTFMANFYRDPDRPISKQQGLVVSPADGHVMFVKRERAIARRPSREEFSQQNCEFDKLTGDWVNSACESPLEFTTEQKWEEVPSGEEGEDDAWRVAIFMSPMDVHVNRSPFAAKITHMEHRLGKGKRRGPFLPAYKKESQYNERVRSVFTSTGEGGHTMGVSFEVIQISGALARTIFPWTMVDDILRRGERYGMIRLGSRVDVRVPASLYSPIVIGADSQNSSYPKGEFVSAGTSGLFEISNVLICEE
ncbi:MAG: hypothetical protein HOB52_01645 [Euryarchaeota archaeon]|nr:hypothetical protein [Euryarchaeota archaeon]